MAKRFEYYILGKDKVQVLSDYKPLMTIFAKPILTSPKRLQRMRLWLQKYPLQVSYKPGPQMFISDTISWAALSLHHTKPGLPEYLTVNQPRRYFSQRSWRDQSQRSTLHHWQASGTDPFRNKEWHFTSNSDVTRCGWPDVKLKTPLNCVLEYWPYREELIDHPKWLISLSWNKNRHSHVNQKRDGC